MNPGEELLSWESCEAEHCPRIAIPAPGTSVMLLRIALIAQGIFFLILSVVVKLYPFGGRSDVFNILF